MKKQSILRQIGRVARSVELWNLNEDGSVTLYHRAFKPISGRCAGRLLNNQKLRDMLALATGILISVDTTEDVDLTPKIKYRKYNKDKKYVIRATKHAESEILYARILPFEDFQIGTTMIKEG